MVEREATVGRGAHAFAFGFRAVTLMLLWVALTGAEPGALVVGVPTAVVAAAVSLALFAPRSHRWSPWGTASFVGFFAWQSIHGAWDVALRALSPSLPINPALVPYAVRLPEGSARWLFCGALSLLPGTSAVTVRGEELLIHVLDETAVSVADIARVEQRAAAVFGISVEPALEAES